MDRKTPCLIIVLAVAILSAGTVSALMPPHVGGTNIEDNGTLKGDTVILTGYSLGYADVDAIRVIAVSTGEALPTQRDLDCHWEGKGDCPGCRQQACTITIKLLAPEPGRTYEFLFLEKTYRFSVAPKSD